MKQEKSYKGYEIIEDEVILDANIQKQYLFHIYKDGLYKNTTTTIQTAIEYIDVMERIEI